MASVITVPVAAIRRRAAIWDARTKVGRRCEVDAGLNSCAARAESLGVSGSLLDGNQHPIHGHEGEEPFHGLRGCPTFLMPGPEKVIRQSSHVIVGQRGSALLRKTLSFGPPVVHDSPHLSIRSRDSSLSRERRTSLCGVSPQGRWLTRGTCLEIRQFNQLSVHERLTIDDLNEHRSESAFPDVAPHPHGGQRKRCLAALVGEQQPLGIQRRIHRGSQPMPHPHCPRRHALGEGAVIFAKLLIHGGTSRALYK